MRNIQADRTSILALDRRHRGWLWSAPIASCVILMLCITVVAYAQPQPDPGHNIDAILLIDNSRSMQTTDPDTLRLRATRFLLDYLRTNARTQGANYRIGLANFGYHVGTSDHLQLLQDNMTWHSLVTETITGTEFVAPLEYAAKELRQGSDRETSKVVVLLTDGQPGPEGQALEDAKLERYFSNDSKLSAIVQELKGMGAEIFVLAIGDAQQDRARWETLIGANYKPVVNTANITDIFHSLFNNKIGFISPAGQILNSDLNVQVDPFLEHLTFSFIKSDPTITLTLTDPSGAVITPITQSEQATYHQIYSVANPSAGNWQIRRQGSGSVEYWIDRRIPQVTLDLNAAFPYSGQPITITARLIRSGIIVTQTQNVHIEAELVAPDIQIASVALAADPSGVYTGVFTATQASGTYTVTARVRLPDGQLLYVRRTPVSIVLQPAALPPTSVPTAETATATPVVTPTSPTPGSGSATDWTPWGGIVLGSLLCGILIVRLYPVKLFPLINRFKITIQNQKRNGQKNSNGLSSKDIPVETLERNLENLYKETGRAKDSIDSDPNNALEIASKVIDEAIQIYDTVEEGLHKPIRESFDIFSGVVKKLIGKGEPLILDEDKAQKFKIWVSRNTREEHVVTDAVIEGLIEILRSSSINKDAIKGQETTKNNLVLLKKSNVHTIWQQKAGYFQVNQPAIQVFEEIISKLLRLIDININEKASPNQSALLKEIAMWFCENRVQDASDYYEYLRKLSQFPLHCIKCPPLGKEFWKSLQIDLQWDRNLQKQFDKVFGQAIPSDVSKMTSRIDTFLKVIEELREPDRSVLKIICVRWRNEIVCYVPSSKKKRQNLSLAPNFTFLQIHILQKILYDWKSHITRSSEISNFHPQNVVEIFHTWFESEKETYRPDLDNWWNALPENIQKESEVLFENCKLDGQWTLTADVLRKVGKKCNTNTCANTHSLCPYLEKISGHGVLFKDLSDNWCIPLPLKDWWDERRKRIALSAVGRIEIIEGKGIGTGVYVGNNLLLTSYHVVEEIKKNQKPAKVRFGNQIWEPGSKVYQLSPWESLRELPEKRFSPVTDWDYALIQIDAPNIELANVHKVNINRAWSPEGKSFTIIHYPDGGNMQVNDGEYVGLANSGRVHFNFSGTKGGSSGAPIFNDEWQLIALHEGADSKPFAILIQSFWPDINGFIR